MKLFDKTFKGKNYEHPTIKHVKLELENGFLTGSHIEEQVLIQKDFNIYTDSYEDKSFNWDNTTFE